MSAQQGSASGGSVRGFGGGRVFWDGDAGVPIERNAGGCHLQFLTFGVRIGAAGHSDSDIRDDRIDTDRDDAGNDFGDDSGRAGCEDPEREPDGDGSGGGLHAGDQQFSAVGLDEPTGNLQWSR